MKKLKASIKKEYLLLKSDIVGLLFMFAMPLVLVFIISIVQDTEFRKLDGNKLSLLVVNHDTGKHSAQLLEMLHTSGMFAVTDEADIAAEEVKATVMRRNFQSALYIPDGFSNSLTEKAMLSAGLMLSDMGVVDEPDDDAKAEMPVLNFYYDPLLQEVYRLTITNGITTALEAIENMLMLEAVYAAMGIEIGGNAFQASLGENRIDITEEPASAHEITPNSTQHNIPAWTIFAMFFIVVSLGNNIVKERLNGSFIRLKTMPVNFGVVMGSKMIIYVGVAFLQALAIFSVGRFIFPLLGLPQLAIPAPISAVIAVVLIIAFAAVSYALMIGALSKTQEQANGIGAVSIIIFAALGGILVPVFAMPSVMQTISMFSPLYWCLESFYFLFLTGGNWLSLLFFLWPVVLFTIICQSVTYIQLKHERII